MNKPLLYLLLGWVAVLCPVVAQTNPLMHLEVTSQRNNFLQDLPPRATGEQVERLTISGYVRDKATGEALPGAVITLLELPAVGVSTNSYGFYSLTLPAGRYTLTASFLGYHAERTVVLLEENQQLELTLTQATTQLSEVEVNSQQADARLSETRTGTHLLPVQAIKAMPAFGGEPDALKSLQLLPGVQVANEGTTNLSVRGGSFDQNLILLDEAPVYNPSHALGFFSVFNPDALQQVEFYKGSIPAQYGGRLSSVVEVRMKEGNNKALKASASVGLVASRATVEGPWRKAAGSFMVSGRYSYVGQTVNGLGSLGQALGVYAFNNFNKGNQISFYDGNAKGNWRLNSRSRLYLSAYTGQDHFYYKDLNANSSMDWGNTTATLRLNHVHSDKLFSNTTVLFSSYRYAYLLKDGATFYKWSSNLRETGVKFDADYYPAPRHHIRFGAALHYHHFMPGKVAPGTAEAPVKTVALDKKQALEPVLYLSNEHKLTERLSLDYGLRYAPFLVMGPATSYSYLEGRESVKDSAVYSAGEVAAFYQALEPRLSARYRLSEQAALKASLTRTTQYLHLVSNSSAGLPTDLWLPSDRNIKPQRAEQLAAGYFRNYRDHLLEASVEVYYKHLHQVIDYKDNADLFLNRHLVTQMRVGKGWGYGAEWLLRKNKGLTTGWIGYTWSVARREIPGVNNSQPYAAPFDKRHHLALTLNRHLSERMQLSSNFVYSTGKATTVPAGSYAWDQTVFVYYTERNGYRLPAYHRLDLSLTLQGKHNESRAWKSAWVFGVYNVYGRKNIFSLYIKQAEDDIGTMSTYKTYLFGVVPSLSYNITL